MNDNIVDKVEINHWNFFQQDQAIIYLGWSYAQVCFILGAGHLSHVFQVLVWYSHI